MKISTIRKLVKWAAVLSVAGVVIELINLIGANIIYKTSGLRAANAFSAPLTLILGVISLAAFILGVIFFINLPKHGKSISTGVLLIISGIFAWFNLAVPLIAWIFAAWQLFRMKFDDDGSNDNPLIL